MRHLLIVSPSAPPKGDPESLQLDRILATLDPGIRVTLITTPPAGGWEKHDPSLDRPRPNVQVLVAALPAHRFTARVLTNHRLRRLHVPDSTFWITWLARSLAQALRHDPPEAIYSRSSPFSSALLSQRLSELLQIPWMMHMSDPWFESPYRSMSAAQARKDRRLEAGCFMRAHKITLTTEGQADYYRRRYPSFAAKISVTPNLMPTGTPAPWISAEARDRDQPIRLVYTGAFYGSRSPAPLLSAVARAILETPTLKDALRIDVYGNATPDCIDAIHACPIAHYHGPVPYDAAVAAQKSADVLLVFEPELKHELQAHFLPSKVLDYLHLGKPILAITPAGSETARLCQSGAGWAFEPGDVASLAATLSKMAVDGAKPPEPGLEDRRMAYQPMLVVPRLQATLSALATASAR